MSFEEQLKKGIEGEGVIARYMSRLGFAVLPVRGRIEDGKGPRVYPAFEKLGIIAPDLLIWKGEKTFWIEVKTKGAFVWYRKTQEWTTGIDLHVWKHYLEITKETPWPVVLMFLHPPGGCAKDTPDGSVSPSGLYGDDVISLSMKIHCTYENFGRHGGVFWREKSLKKFATYETVSK